MTEREQIKEELRKEYQELYMNESRFMKKISELFAQKAYESIGSRVNRNHDALNERIQSAELRLTSSFAKANAPIEESIIELKSELSDFKNKIMKTVCWLAFINLLLVVILVVKMIL